MRISLLALLLLIAPPFVRAQMPTIDATLDGTKLTIHGTVTGQCGGSKLSAGVGTATTEVDLGGTGYGYCSNHCEFTWEYDLACWPYHPSGTIEVAVYGYTHDWINQADDYCNRDERIERVATSVTLNRKPTISLGAPEEKLLPSGQSDPAVSLVPVTYNFPAGGNGHIQLRWADNNAFISEWTTTNSSGTVLREVPACTLGDVTQVYAIATVCVEPPDKSDPVEIPQCVLACTEECKSCIGDPIHLTSGSMQYADSDPLPGSAATFRRTYQSSRAMAGSFGLGWISPFEARLSAYGGTSGFDDLMFRLEDGSRYLFRREGTGPDFSCPSANGAARGRCSRTTRTADPSAPVTATGAGRGPSRTTRWAA